MVTGKGRKYNKEGQNIKKIMKRAIISLRVLSFWVPSTLHRWNRFSYDASKPLYKHLLAILEMLEIQSSHPWIHSFACKHWLSLSFSLSLSLTLSVSSTKLNLINRLIDKLTPVPFHVDVCCHFESVEPEETPHMHVALAPATFAVP